MVNKTGRHLKSNLIAFSVVEAVFSKEYEFSLANGIAIRKYGLSHKRHFEHGRLRKPLPNVVVTDVERTQESDKANDGSDVRKQATLVEEAMESNDSFDSKNSKTNQERL